MEIESWTVSNRSSAESSGGEVGFFGERAMVRTDGEARRTETEAAYGPLKAEKSGEFAGAIGR